MTTINSQEDFLQALRDNPAWREAVRAQILGEELLQLPVRFQAFEKRMNEFVTKQEAFNERQEAFNEGMGKFVTKQEAFNERQEIFNRNALNRFDRMETDISVVKAGHARSFGREAAEVIAMELGLEYVRTLTQAELLRIYRDADGNLSQGERRSFQNADMVIEASGGDGTVYISAEISYTADHRDSDRALRNAKLLNDYTGNRAIATIASVRNDQHVASLVESQELHWYQMDSKIVQVE